MRESLTIRMRAEDLAEGRVCDFEDERDMLRVFIFIYLLIRHYLVIFLFFISSLSNRS